MFFQKDASLEIFYEKILRIPFEYFCAEVFIERNLSEIKDKHFISHF